jgi:hypothetical protein
MANHPDVHETDADVDYLRQAKQMADRRGGPMNPVYIYDFEGTLVYEVGPITPAWDAQYLQ